LPGTAPSNASYPHIPEFAKLQVHTGENPDGTMKLEDARRSTTMRELLTHSAGLGYVLNQANAVDRQIIKEQSSTPRRRCRR
jgi:CubicO group peptidase (beta-lactamase class C family)